MDLTSLKMRPLILVGHILTLTTHKVSTGKRVLLALLYYIMLSPKRIVLKEDSNERLIKPLPYAMLCSKKDVAKR